MNPQQPGGPYPPYDPNQQQYPAPQPLPQQQHTQYDFILNPGAPGKRKLVSIGGGSTMKRALLAVGGLAVVVVIVIVVASLLSGGSSTPPLIGVAQDQTELIRVSTLVNGHTNNQAKLNFALTAQLSLTTSQKDLLQYMAKNGEKTSESSLLLKHSKTTDQRLSAAAANSTFDSEFTAVMQEDLKTYMNDLQAAYKTSTGPNGKQLLSNAYNAADLLTKQSAQ